MLDLIDSTPELSVFEISKNLKIHYKTASSHLRRLIIAGLILKRSKGKDIRHKVSERGKTILRS